MPVDEFDKQGPANNDQHYPGYDYPFTLLPCFFRKCIYTRAIRQCFFGQQHKSAYKDPDKGKNMGKGICANNKKGEK